MTNLSKQLCIVTGGANGIGLEIAKGFLQEGNYVVIVDYNKEACQNLDIELAPYKGNFYWFCGDASSEETVGDVFSWLKQNGYEVNILVNNAAISPKHDGKRISTELMSLEEWNLVMNVNLTSVFLWTKYSIPHMRPKKWGRIINLSSVAGRTYSRIAGSHYAATKAAIIGFSRTVATELGEDNITINSVAPGRIETNMAKETAADVNQNFLKQIPLKRNGTIQEVVNAVLFLSSDKASYITGSTIDVNGGIFMN